MPKIVDRKNWTPRRGEARNAKPPSEIDMLASIDESKNERPMDVQHDSFAFEMSAPRGDASAASSVLRAAKLSHRSETPRDPSDRKNHSMQRIENFAQREISDWTLGSDKLLRKDPFCMRPVQQSNNSGVKYDIITGERRARDATGLEAKKYVVAWSHPAYQERVVTSYDRVTHLETYMRQSRQAILQVRAFNRGSVSVVPVCAAVFALPSMYDYDFMSMVEWNAASPLPMPNLTQPIYGAPIVSRETRNEVIEYLLDIMRVLMDIIYALEPDSLGADTRRLQEQYWQDTTSNLSTPLHMEVVAGALAHLSANLAPIGEPELFVFLGTLTSGLVERVRGSRGDIRKAGNAPQDLVKTLSFLLASIRPIDKPREGVLRPNITEHVQARLSAEIIRTAVALGDVMAAIADPGGPPTAIKQAMPQGDAYMNSVDGDLVVTIIKKKLIDIIVDGVQTQPDYQSMQRWIYPQITIDGLGPPGNDGASWAGDATVLFNEAAKQCQEAQEDFLQTITMTTISWPVSPFLYATGTQIGMNINVTVHSSNAFMWSTCGDSGGLWQDSADLPPVPGCGARPTLGLWRRPTVPRGLVGR
eukprot:symbB.v1.2.016667.t1/scaffold1250.1/size128898/9